MEFLINHWTDILLGLTSIVTGASVIAKLTPTKTDDRILGQILHFIDIIAINTEPTETK